MTLLGDGNAVAGTPQCYGREIVQIDVERWARLGGEDHRRQLDDGHGIIRQNQAEIAVGLGERHRRIGQRRSEIWRRCLRVVLCDAVLPDGCLGIGEEAVDIEGFGQRWIGKIAGRSCGVAVEAGIGLIDHEQVELAIGFEDGEGVDGGFVVFAGGDQRSAGAEYF